MSSGSKADETGEVRFTQVLQTVLQLLTFQLLCLVAFLGITHGLLIASFPYLSVFWAIKFQSQVHVDDLEAHVYNGDESDNRKSLNAGQSASTIQWEDLNVLASLPNGNEKRILHGISGEASSGDMLALMGPSGSGKTTLLQALAGRPTGRLEGKLNIDGKRPSKNTRRKTALVTQVDLMWEALTVRETLEYAALLRLPESMPRKSKLNRCREVAGELGLLKCYDTVVGGVGRPGISGGEKKRLSVAIELLSRPSLLILDEPTSGLDATIALKLINLLHKQSTEKRRVTVVLSIHQPSTRVFQAMTTILALSEGETMYKGGPFELAPYFSSLGHDLPEQSNPADWLLDIASGDFYSSDIGNTDAQSERKRLCDRFRQDVEKKEKISKWTDEKTGLVVSDAPVDNDNSDKLKDDSWTWPTSWGFQVVTLVSRMARAKSDSALDPWKIFQHIFLALVAGLLWFRAGQDRTPGAIQDVSGLLFFSVTVNSFAPLFQSLFAFPGEREIVRKEKSSGWYQLSSYYVARAISDIPLELLQPFLFVPIMYFMAGLRETAGAFLGHFFVTCFSTLTATSIGLLISSSVMDFNKAQVAAACFLLATMLLGGASHICFLSQYLCF